MDQIDGLGEGTPDRRFQCAQTVDFPGNYLLSGSD